MSCSEACWERYLATAAFESEHIPALGQFHQLMVDAYGAQHPIPPTPAIRVTYSLVGLHLALEVGWSGLDVRGAHSRMGKPQPGWPTFRPPADRHGLTVSDVARAGEEDGPAAYARLMRRWAQSVWQAWSGEHEQIAHFTSSLHL